jgi:hypothetical protein
VTYGEWPGVNDATTALREAFGHASVEDHLRSFCILVPIEALGILTVGDIDGPLGESNRGWGVERYRPDGEYVGPVCKVPDRSVPDLVAALRAFVRDGTRVGLTHSDLVCIRRDEHQAATGHFVHPTHIADPGCAECQRIYRDFQDSA